MRPPKHPFRRGDRVTVRIPETPPGGGRSVRVSHKATVRKVLVPRTPGKAVRFEIELDAQGYPPLRYAAESLSPLSLLERLAEAADQEGAQNGGH